MEAQIHRDIFILFYNVWTNPQCKIYEVVKYLLETSPQNSRTWAVHIRYLANKYGLKDPLDCLKIEAPSKATYKELIDTKIAAFHETELRALASQNSCMQFFNVSLIGLRGRPHPALTVIKSTHDVKKARHHIKMLGGDYYTYEIKSKQSGGSPLCKSCEQDENEDLIHIISRCEAYNELRQNIRKEYEQHCSKTKTTIDFKNLCENEIDFCQFVLDPSSINLVFG